MRDVDPEALAGLQDGRQATQDLGLFGLVAGIRDQQAVDADAELIGQLLARPLEEEIIDLSGGDGRSISDSINAGSTPSQSKKFSHMLLGVPSRIRRSGFRNLVSASPKKVSVCTTSALKR
ncbi:MAG: hypothetical protein V5B38_10645 [Candidatus Accumulibacter propinquus]